MIVDVSALLGQIRGDTKERDKGCEHLEERQMWQACAAMRARMVLHADNIKSTQTTYVLIDIKECCHDGILDGSQI